MKNDAGNATGRDGYMFADASGNKEKARNKVDSR
jgi:hypothetical protein